MIGPVHQLLQCARILNRFLLTKGLRTRTCLLCCLFRQWNGTKWVFFKHLYFQVIFLHLKMGKKRDFFFIWQFFKISKDISHFKFYRKLTNAWRLNLFKIVNLHARRGLKVKRLLFNKKGFRPIVRHTKSWLFILGNFS